MVFGGGSPSVAGCVTVFMQTAAGKSYPSPVNAPAFRVGNPGFRGHTRPIQTGDDSRQARRIPQPTMASVASELSGIRIAATSGFIRPDTANPTASRL